MTSLATALIAVTVFFFIFLGLRSMTNSKVCAICASTSTLWILLLILLYSGAQIDPTLVGILMGGSAVGSMYFLEKRSSNKHTIFRLPFLLTLFTLIYLVLEKTFDVAAIATLLALWTIFVAFFFLQDSRKWKTAIEKIIDCCKNW